MTPAWAQRREALLRDCIVSPDVFTSMVERLGDFVVPDQRVLETEVGQRNVPLYLEGLLSHLGRKNAEEIATFVHVERQVLQDFIGTAPWDHQPLVKVLVSQVADRLGEPEGIIAFDPSSFPKRGTHSVGVKRQWCGHRGKGRQLPGRRLHGLRLCARSCLARLPVVPARGLGTRRATTPGMPRPARDSLPNASGAVFGDARRVA